MMPRLGFGVWQIRDQRAESIVGSAITAGFRHIDTAQAYGNEAGVGRAVRSTAVPREELFVTSKLRGRDTGHAPALRSFDESLKRLGLDYLDLCLIHWPMPALDRYVETWQALIELKATGRVRSIGVSNFTPAHIDRLQRETGVIPAVNQIEVHPFFQQRALRDYHHANGIVIESYSPLGGSGNGVLRHPTVTAIAAKHGRTPAQIVLRWHLEQGLVPLPKTGTTSRIPENLAVWDFALNPADMEQLRGLDQRHGNTQPSPDSMNSSF
ncbi:aldo/keto reductase [Paenirhodobacter sp.]|uniref:aldo/keto reductase n=1 Tax=Paenirhodobacter sp. TaxID=1965326 RepID=UPI003B4088A7